MGFSNSYDHIGHTGGEPWRQGHFIKVQELTPGRLETKC